MGVAAAEELQRLTLGCQPRTKLSFLVLERQLTKEGLALLLQYFTMK